MHRILCMQHVFLHLRHIFLYGILIGLLLLFRQLKADGDFPIVLVQLGHQARYGICYLIGTLEGFQRFHDLLKVVRAHYLLRYPLQVFHGEGDVPKMIRKAPIH